MLTPLCRSGCLYGFSAHANRAIVGSVSSIPATATHTSETGMTPSKPTASDRHSNNTFAKAPIGSLGER